ITRAAAGDLLAARALHIGFWPFVHEFEKAIDSRMNGFGALLRILYANFSKDLVRGVWQFIAPAVRQMQQEEGQHSAHWLKDAECLGLHDIGGFRAARGVQALIDSAYTDNFPEFFAVLAATEYISEELSKFLIAQPAYTDLFDRKRWVWGEIHAEPHQDEVVSHLVI